MDQAFLNLSQVKQSLKQRAFLFKISRVHLPLSYVRAAPSKIEEKNLPLHKQEVTIPPSSLKTPKPSPKTTSLVNPPLSPPSGFKANKKIDLEEESYEDLKAKLSVIFPKIAWLDAPCDDALAREKQKTRSLDLQLFPCILFVQDHDMLHTPFLQHLTNLLKLYLPVKILLSSKLPLKSFKNSLNAQKNKLILGLQNDLQSLSKQSISFKVNACTYVEDIPFICLSHLSHYPKNKSLKIALWEALKPVLKELPSNTGAQK